MTKRLETRSFESPDSTNVKRVEWIGAEGPAGDDSNGELRVYFLNGSAYAYEGVPVIVFKELREAESVGSVFHDLVRKPGRYKPTKLDEPTLKRNPAPDVIEQAEEIDRRSRASDAGA